MPEFLQRMIDERNELKEKIDKLEKFTKEGPTAHPEVKELQWNHMDKQLDFMVGYYNLLCARIGDLV